MSGSLFRSEEMSLCQIFLQSEAAYACISQLGELGLVQFKDLNPDVNAFQRKFVSEILRCDEMERRLRYIEKELKKEELKVPDTDENPSAPAPKEMIDLEATFEKIESELREVNTNAEALKRNFLELSELKEVLKKTQVFFQEHGQHNIIGDAQHALGQADDTQTGTIQLGFVAGVIPRERMPAFERMLWFACRGNVFLRYEEIPQVLEDPVTGDGIHKSVFIIFFQGDQLKSRVRKICEGFKATLYPCPENPQERNEMLNGVSTRLEDLKTVLNQTKDHRNRVLVGVQKEITAWIIKVKKIKAIYHTLNMCNFDLSHNSLIAECWCPVMALEDVQRGLKHGTELSGSTVPCILHRMDTKETPPTYFITNKFTQVFQDIVDAYGIATYQEVNPALYTIISFPFLFAVMFGDMGHGTIMFLFGLTLVLMEKKLISMKVKDEIANTFINGRYIIMMMGAFSIYTGFIYNDIFSKSLNLFGSSWYPYYKNTTFVVQKSFVLDPGTMYDTEKGPYPLGLDPIWNAATNKITYTNSFKMKLSVILGISQMTLGVLLSLVNHIYFKRTLEALVEFIPALLFLLCLFGYLVGLVFYKWFLFNQKCTQCAPSLLIHFINMFLMKYQPVGNLPGTNTTTFECREYPKDLEKLPCSSQTVFFDNQQMIQTILLVAGVLMAPIMLCVKPFVLRSQHNTKERDMEKRKQGLGAVSERALIHQEEIPDNSSMSVDKPTKSDIELKSSVNHKDVDVEVEGHAVHDKHEDEVEFEFGEVFIHQAIHTIEFCLGCISHTASYLRLWALSLAHAQLSEVLWNMLLRLSLKMDIPYGGSVIIFFIFGAFACITVAVLLVMEGLSAFLHTIRLHWVEFNSKFYSGQGYGFIPFSFKSLMEPTLDD
ncbi:V-type proton ATPase 116 kDa subunit a 1-like isoform X3 [Mytilus californianus]|uniref:V-type proton ATPase 116 kDa subunit a 1-like isoform X3 n=1 Tax=Mytilus californianus TaxID=6549 RepID=UPI002246113C|nr:V-type proton ATPase 116 kDa subunit a 1-like isoform X3 [Mytilus californianus]